LISNISKRYARAFFEIAAQEKQLEKYYNDTIKWLPLLLKIMHCVIFWPIQFFEQAVKKNVVEKIISKLQLSNMTINFLKLLVDKQRIGVLPDIEICYRQMMDEALKKVRVI